MCVASTTCLGFSYSLANCFRERSENREQSAQCRPQVFARNSKLLRTALHSRQVVGSRKNCRRRQSDTACRISPKTMSAAVSPTENDVAVVLVDHGSKRAEANEMLEEFAALYRCVHCYAGSIACMAAVAFQNHSPQLHLKVIFAFFTEISAAGKGWKLHIWSWQSPA